MLLVILLELRKKSTPFQGTETVEISPTLYCYLTVTYAHLLFFFLIPEVVVALWVISAFGSIQLARLSPDHTS